VPKLGGGQVVITSRKARWEGSVTSLSLDLLSEEAAVAYLLERTAARRQPQPDDGAHARALAQELGRLALAINEKSYGAEHPNVAIRLNNLAVLLRATNRLAEAEALMRRHLAIFLRFGRATGHQHPHLETAVDNYRILLLETGLTEDQVRARLHELAPDFFQ
jgi:hypothetical protein